MKKRNIIILSIVFLCFLTIVFFQNSAENINLVAKENAITKLSNKKESNKKIDLTSKNKQKGNPYINPRYEEYMKLSDKEKAKVELVPKKYIVDFQYEESIFNQPKLYNYTAIPTKYDLRNVNGYNYVTSVKDQGNLGLCWAFASMASLESNLLKNNKGTYDFSERQIDYGTSYDGFIEEDFSNGNRYLTEGGNFSDVSSLFDEGLTPVKESIFGTYNENTVKKSISTVLNPTNSTINVLEYIEYPYLNFSVASDSELLAYNNVIKNHLINYGAMYVGIDMQIENIDPDTNFLYTTDYEFSLHAVTIIGWDDNYGPDLDNDGKPEGAWLVKNSWGDYDEYYPYFYVSYIDYNLSDFTGISKTETKTWDKNYTYSETENTNYGTEYEEFNYKKIPSINENLTEISLSSDYKGIYKLYIKNSNTDYINVGELNFVYPGKKTLNLDNPISLNGNNFSLKIIKECTNYCEVMPTIYTEYTDTNENKYVDISLSKTKISTKNTYMNSFNIILNTYNIPNGKKVTYKITNSANQDVTNKFQINDHQYIVSDSLNNLVDFESVDVVDDTYTIKAFIEGINYAETQIEIVKELEIKTEEDLYNIKNNMEGSYKLVNDIDLTSYTTEGGIYYNSGKGWDSIGEYTEYSEICFDGSLNGNGYKINGLNINRTDEEAVGLFKCIDDDATVENIVFENGTIKGNEMVGTVAGYSRGNINRITNTNTIIANKYAGGIVGQNIGDISSSSNDGAITITSESVGGIAGQNAGRIYNAYNVGIITGSSCVGGITGYNMENIINVYNAGTITGTTYIGGISGYLYEGSININGYDISDVIPAYNNEDDAIVYNTKEYTIENMKKVNTYQNIDSTFIWNIEEGHLPTLSSNEIKYFDNIGADIIINIKKGQQNNYEITTEGTPSINTIMSYITDTSIATLNSNTITGVENGNTNMIVFTVDGKYAFNVNINVYSFEGSGTKESPYKIYTTTDMNNINAEMNAYYELQNDLDYTNIDYYPIGDSFNEFAGVFNGKNHTIKNIDFTSNDDEYVYSVGVFAYIKNATISNLYLEESSIISGDVVGGIVGEAIDSNIYNVGIKNCTIKGDKVGGIVGNLYRSNVKNVYNTGNITGISKAGGIAGYTYSSYIFNAYNTGTITANDGYAGGILGEEDTYDYESNKNKKYNSSLPGYIYNVYNIGIIEGETIGGIASEISRGTTVLNAYDLKNDIKAIGYSYNATLNNVVEKTLDELKKKSTFSGFNFNRIWNIVANETPKLIVGAPLEDEYILVEEKITNVIAKTTLNKLISNMIEYKLIETGPISDDDVYAGTGTVISIDTTDDSIDNPINYTIIVNGDVTGDGIVNIADVIKTADHSLTKDVLNETYNQEAADVTYDGVINIADVIRMADYTLNNSKGLWR